MFSFFVLPYFDLDLTVPMFNVLPFGHFSMRVHKLLFGSLSFIPRFCCHVDAYTMLLPNNV